MARLYTNENFPLPSVEVLRKLGHDVLTSRDAGKANRFVPDEDVLDFAKQEKRILLTHNRKHFFRLHRLDPRHPGIIACTYNPDFDQLVSSIHVVLGSMGGGIENELVRVNSPNR